MEIGPGIKGIWFRPGEEKDEFFPRNAQWIWLDEDKGHDVLLARKTFTVDRVPESAVLRITATSVYSLYVNGRYICRGPARCVPHHQSYDVLEIAGSLHQGENLVAVSVHFQKGKYSYHFEGRAGLLVHLDLKPSEFSLISDREWRVSNDPSRDEKSPPINRFQDAVTDRVDFRNYLTGWNQPGFDDSSWIYATPLMRNSGWPAPQENAGAQALTPPWTLLVPRDIPYLYEKDVMAIHLTGAFQTTEKILEKSVEFHGKVSLESGMNSGEQLEIPKSGPGKAWFLLFDLGEVFNGLPNLKIKGAPGTEVEIACAPYLVDSMFTCRIVDSGFLDRIILSGGDDSWEATYIKPARYLAFVVKNGSGPVKIYSAGIHQVAYPFKETGSIRSDDAPWVEKYMDASAKTIRVCTTDAYTDNYRERRQYAQTGYYAALGNYWIFGDHALQRRYLVQIAQEQEANGMMPAYAPAAGEDFMVIMDSNCLWIGSLQNYLLYSGDFKTVRDLLPAGRKLMELLQSYTNSSGLLDDPPFPYWLDHALNDRRGANFTLNAHYLGALEDFAKVLAWMDEPGSEVYEKRAVLLRESLRKNFWDPDKQLFADALINENRSDMFSEHANAMALAMNVATPVQEKQVAEKLIQKDNHNYIIRESGLTMVTPAMSYFLHKGLCKFGYTGESIRMFRERFDKMLDPGTNGTLWEEWWLDATGRTGRLQKGRTRSDAQTESAFPPALFAEYLLGLTPVKPGIKEMELKKPSYDLKHIEGKIPTPRGTLHVEWNHRENETELILEIPTGTTISLVLESLGQIGGSGARLNGKPLKAGIGNKQYLKLTAGNHTFKF